MRKRVAAMAVLWGLERCRAWHRRCCGAVEGELECLHCFRPREGGYRC